MLLNLSKKSWTAGLTLTNFQQHNESNEKVVKELKALADRYDKVGKRTSWGRGEGDARYAYVHHLFTSVLLHSFVLP